MGIYLEFEARFLADSQQYYAKLYEQRRCGFEISTYMVEVQNSLNKEEEFINQFLHEEIRSRLIRIVQSEAVKKCPLLLEKLHNSSNLFEKDNRAELTLLY